MAKRGSVGPVALSSMGGNHPRIQCSYFEEPAAYLLSEHGKSPLGLHVNCSQNKRRKTLEPEVELSVRFNRRAYDFAKLPRSLEGPCITEFAAVGLALLFLPHLAEGQVTEVTKRGRHELDYWVDDRECLLEVSGTLSRQRLTSRHRKKVETGADNPHGVAYFVSVSSFEDLRNIFSFHEFE